MMVGSGYQCCMGMAKSMLKLKQTMKRKEEEHLCQRLKMGKIEGEDKMGA